MDQLTPAIDYLHKKMTTSRADDFEIYARATDRLVIEAKDGDVDSFSRASESGVSVRVISDGRLGMSSSTDLTEHALDRVVAQSVDSARVATTDPNVCLPKWADRSQVLEESAECALDTVSDDRKIDVAKQIERAALSVDSKVSLVRQPRYREEIFRVGVVDKSGQTRDASRGVAYCELQAVAQEGGVSESAWESLHTIDFAAIDAEKLGRAAGRRAVSLLGSRSVKSGKYSVYFEPRSAANLLRICASSFFADNVQRNMSRLCGQRGKKIFGEPLSIVDDGLLSGGAFSFPFDAEGVSRQKTVLVSDGRIGNWLYDGISAMRDGVNSTGNAVRFSIHSAPQIGVTNIYIKEGTFSPEDLLHRCDGGLCVSEILGLHTANTITGDFSLGAIGYLIEDGVGTQPVRGITIAANIFDLFSKIDGIGNNLTFFYQYGAPSLVAPDVQISGNY